MATLQKTTNKDMTGDNHTQRGTKAGSFLRRLSTMSLAMGAGIALFHLLVLLIRASSSDGALFEPGTDLYSIGMAIFMTVPTWIASQCGNGGRIARSNSC
jgi:hypothetical protein